jgi:hypothetical protein
MGYQLASGGGNGQKFVLTKNILPSRGLHYSSQGQGQTCRISLKCLPDANFDCDSTLVQV